MEDNQTKEKETFEATGKVISTRRDKKGVKLDDENQTWYSNSFLPELNVNMGDEVKITFTKNGNFCNYETVEVVKKAETQTTESSTPSKTASMLTSYAKDLVMAQLSNNMPKVNMNELMQEASIAVVNTYLDIEAKI